ncbi:hypothetical protein CLU83_1663 [Flavobacterium sp. 1]|nr:hypothetical protein CLU83_1663 [Flavobacterium sp. 1]
MNRTCEMVNDIIWDFKKSNLLKNIFFIKLISKVYFNYKNTILNCLLKFTISG